MRKFKIDKIRSLEQQMTLAKISFQCILNPELQHKDTESAIATKLLDYY